jgi:hypothetical protein
MLLLSFDFLREMYWLARRSLLLDFTRKVLPLCQFSIWGLCLRGLAAKRRCAVRVQRQVAIFTPTLSLCPNYLYGICPFAREARSLCKFRVVIFTPQHPVFGCYACPTIRYATAADTFLIRTTYFCMCEAYQIPSTIIHSICSIVSAVW